MMHKQFIYVPKTVEDMKRGYFGYEDISCYEWILYHNEFNALWDCRVFKYLSEKFDVLVDTYEDSWIFYQHLYFHYEELTEEFKKFRCKDEIKMLTGMIDKAIESRTCIGFFL